MPDKHIYINLGHAICIYAYMYICIYIYVYIYIYIYPLDGQPCETNACKIFNLFYFILQIKNILVLLGISIDTTIYMHHRDINKRYRKKLHGNYTRLACCLEQILEATSNKTAAVQPHHNMVIRYSIVLTLFNCEYDSYYYNKKISQNLAEFELRININ